MTVRIVTKDRGWKELKSKLGRRLHGLSVSVGVQGDEARQLHPSGTGATMAEVAAYNEFGTRTSPPRPFLSTAFDKHKGWRKELTRLVTRALETGASPENLAEELRAQVVSDVQDVMQSNVFTPNAPATVRKKGHGDTLRDSYALSVDGVTAKVTRTALAPATLGDLLPRGGN